MGKGFPFGSHADRVGGKLSGEVGVTSGVPQRSVLGPLLCLGYVNDIWRNTGLTIRLFADDCLIYKKNIKNEDIEKMQKDLDRLGKWAAENAIKMHVNVRQFVSREPG